MSISGSEAMLIALIQITDENDLHIRPGALLVKACKEFSSAITVENKGRKANAKSLMKLMSAGLHKGDVITLTIEGGDEVMAMEKLKVVIENLEGSLRIAPVERQQ